MMKKSEQPQAAEALSALTAETAREGIRRFLPMATLLASMTRTDIDDKGVALLSAIVNSDEVWAAIINALPQAAAVPRIDN